MILTCETRFAAFRAFPVVYMKRSEAAILVFFVWLTSLMTGFGLLYYPRTASCYIWNAGLLAAAWVGLAGADYIGQRITLLRKNSNLPPATLAVTNRWPRPGVRESDESFDMSHCHSECVFDAANDTAADNITAYLGFSGKLARQHVIRERRRGNLTGGQ
jgi:hypothetical protein